MRVYLYEHLVALQTDPTSSMHVEGRAMLDAIRNDFQSAGWETVVIDERLEKTTLIGGCGAYGLVIAPEEVVMYWKLYEPFRNHDIRLLNCDDASTAMAADKLKMFHLWSLNDVCTPVTILLDGFGSLPPVFQGPSVMKERRGTGSQNMYLCHNKREQKKAFMRYVAEHASVPINQEFIDGQSASIAFLVGPNQTIPLRAAFQNVSDDGCFHYLGGCVPIATDLEARAVNLGLKAIQCVPGLLGYIGVDLVFNPYGLENRDNAIEINPRLTTSYVGLRALSDFNLAQAMIDVVEGRPVDYIKWKPGRVRFWPDGRVEYDPTPGAVYE